MNKMPLPVHLLMNIRGFSLLGQTSFGGYFKIVLSWWQNDCPEIFEETIEWCSLSGMYQRDYDRHKNKIEPVLLKSLEVLKEYRNERLAKTANKRAGMIRARAAWAGELKRRKSQTITKGNIVDKHVLVNPTPVKPPSQPFHEGWNLEQPHSPRINRKSTVAPTLFDK